MPWIQQGLAKVHAKAQVLRLMNWKQAWAAESGRPEMAAASAIKVYGSELNIEAYRTFLEILGAAAVLRRDAKGAALRGRLESSYRSGLILTFGGGTNEIQRDIIEIGRAHV